MIFATFQLLDKCLEQYDDLCITFIDQTEALRSTAKIASIWRTIGLLRHSFGWWVVETLQGHSRETTSQAFPLSSPTLSTSACSSCPCPECARVLQTNWTHQPSSTPHDQPILKSSSRLWSSPCEMMGDQHDQPILKSSSRLWSSPWEMMGDQHDLGFINCPSTCNRLLANGLIFSKHSRFSRAAFDSIDDADCTIVVEKINFSAEIASN